MNRRRGGGYGCGGSGRRVHVRVGHRGRERVRGGETWGGVGEVRGDAWRSQARRGSGGSQEVARHVASARRARAPAFWREVGGDWRWPVGWAGTVPG